MAGILVVIEHRKQRLTDISLEMLSKGRQLADQWGSELIAVVIAKDIDKYAAETANWADKVLAVKEDKLEGSLAEPYQKIMSVFIKERKTALVLIGHSSFGMDLAPALAVEVGSPFVSDCTDISIADGNVTVKRALYNGKIEATYSFVPSPTIIVTGRPGQFTIEQGQKKGTVEKIDSPLDGEIDYKRFEGYVEPPETDEVDITKSSILVSVGRGIKDKDSIAMAEQLAKLLGGDLACSRPVSDNKWLSEAHHVGLSGKIVKPKLYLALGISGAFQHTVGIKGAETIVAINKDPKAHIFAVADYGIVDDIFKVVPALIQRLS
jgi:electron transfer flavoprotein alpha subunit